MENRRKEEKEKEINEEEGAGGAKEGGFTPSPKGEIHETRIQIIGMLRIEKQEGGDKTKKNKRK